MQSLTAFSGRKHPVVQDYDPETPQPVRVKRWASQGKSDRKLHTSLLPPELANLQKQSVIWRRETSQCFAFLGTLVLLLWFLCSGKSASRHRNSPDLAPAADLAWKARLFWNPFKDHRHSPPNPPSLTKIEPRIPRIVHQTYKIAEPPYEVLPFMQSWRDLNQGYEFRFYDDESCLDFVRTEFPGYYNSYVGLPKDVERSDFFRYMVLLRYGGIYADIDTECKIPIDTLLLPTDAMVVGWENEWATNAVAFEHHYVRRRQVLQWVIAASPGHPVLQEVCDFIASHALSKFSNNTNRDTLERTGPGVWTDIVLRHALSTSSKWPVRILPRVAFGINPKDAADPVPADYEGVAVLHHFLGSWKVRGGWKTSNAFSTALASFAMR
mmetsp:Transcript_13518/g.38436  ORF Transcript_13518/g.38436 Transcript_13518/m.38436 type:complete len:382 (-) Transcript_13518:1448-2593(-)